MLIGSMLATRTTTLSSVCLLGRAIWIPQLSQHLEFLDEADLDQLLYRDAHAGHLRPRVFPDPHEDGQDHALENVVAILQQAQLLLSNNLETNQPSHRNQDG